MTGKKLQVVFQGGGAKLSQLLAVAEVLQELEKNGDIKVTRVAGTSAGSIVAGLYASNFSIKEVREYLLGHGKTWKKKLFSKQPKFIIATKFTWKYFVWNEPLVDPSLLNEFIISLMDSRREVSDDVRAKKTCKIIATNINTGQKKVYVFNADRICKDAGEVCEAIVNSCSIPVLFRTSKHANTNSYVDGGILENFPVDDLVDGSDEHGKIIGISFRPNTISIKAKSGNHNRFSFLLRPLLASIDQLTAKARSTAEHLFEIPEPLGTFDFEEALAFLDSEGYDSLKERFSQWVESSVDANSPIETSLVSKTGQEKKTGAEKRPEILKGFLHALDSLDTVYKLQMLMISIRSNINERPNFGKIEQNFDDANLYVTASHVKTWIDALNFDRLAKFEEDVGLVKSLDYLANGNDSGFTQNNAKSIMELISKIISACELLKSYVLDDSNPINVVLRGEDQSTEIAHDLRIQAMAVNLQSGYISDFSMETIIKISHILDSSHVKIKSIGSKLV